MTAADEQSLSGPSQAVHYDFWGRMPGWTIAEAAALLLNIDPDHLATGSRKDSMAGR